MFKNVATKLAIFAFDTTTGAPKTGDAANLTAYVSKDYGAVTVLGDTSATEMDATNAKGWYLFDLVQAETNADALLFTGKSATANITLVGQLVFTTPNRFTTLVIDAAGLADSNSVKMGPSGSGATQTARDIGASVLLAAGTGTGQLDFTSGVVKANATQIAGAAVDTTAAQLGVNVVNWKGSAAAAMTGDAYARLGAPVGASISADVAAVQADTDNIQTRLPTALVSGRMDSSVGAMAADVVTASAIATDAFGALELAAGAASEIATAVRTELTTELGRIDAAVTTRASQTSLDTVDDFVDTEVAAIKAKTDQLVFTVANQVDVNVVDWKGAAAPAMTGDAYARLGAPAGASVSADVAAVKAVDDAVKTQTDKLTFTVANQIDANVLDWKSATAPAMTGDAFARLGAPAGASVSADVAAVKVDTAAVKAKTDNLPTDPADASDVAAAFSTVNGTLATIAGYVDTEVAAIKTDTAAIKLQTDLIPAAPAAVSDVPTAAAVADAVWDEAVADHAGVGSTGAALAAAGGSGDPWATALPGAYGAGTAGQIVGDFLDAPVSGASAPTAVQVADEVQTRTIAAVTLVNGLANDVITAAATAADFATEVQTGLATAANLALVKAKTDNLPTDPADASDIAAAFAVVQAAIPTAVQNADALLNRDMSVGTDSGSPTVRTPRQALRMLRNRFTAAGTDLTVYKEDDTTPSWTSVLTVAPGADPISGSDPA